MKRIIPSVPIIVRVLMAIIIGAALGLFVPHWFVRIFVTFNTFFAQFISFLVPLILLALVTASIANAEGSATKMLRITMVALLVSTFMAGVAALGAGQWLLPKFLNQGDESLLLSAEGDSFKPLFTLVIPPTMDVMSALVLALILGWGIRAVKAEALKNVITDLQQLIMLSIERIIVPLLPVYIFGVFLKMSAAGGMVELVKNFLWIILIVIGMLLAWVLILYLFAGAYARKNPFRLIQSMFSAGIVAFATCSSAATIPFSLKAAKKMVKSDNTANFVMPLCANLHIPSVTIHFVICALAVMLMVGQPLDYESFFVYIMMLTLTCVAVPGVPGGVVAVLPVMATVLGFSQEMQAVCLSLGILLDAPLTAANVICDGAICAFVDEAVAKETPNKP